MQPMELYEILHRKPFQPFRVHLADGCSYDVRYPHLSVVGTTYFQIGFPMPGRPEFYDDLVFVDPQQIMRVEFLDSDNGPG